MKILSVLIIGFFLHTGAKAQEGYKDLYNVSVAGGVTDIGSVYKLGFVRAVNEKLGIKAQAYADISSKKLAKLINTGLDVKAQYYVGSLGNYTNFFIGGGATISVVNDNTLYKPAASQSTSKLMYGIVGDAEIEFSISQEVKLFVEGNQRFLFSGIYGRKWWDVSGGIKFYLFNN